MKYEWAIVLDLGLCSLQFIRESLRYRNLSLFICLRRPVILWFPSDRNSTLRKVHVRPSGVYYLLFTHSGLLVELKEQPFVGCASRKQLFQVFLLVDLRLLLNVLWPIVLADNSAYTLRFQKQHRDVELIPTAPGARPFCLRNAANLSMSFRSISSRYVFAHDSSK